MWAIGIGSSTFTQTSDELHVWFLAGCGYMSDGFLCRDRYRARTGERETETDNARK